MADPDDSGKDELPGSINPFEASASALAQSIANSAQDQVDVVRNQNIIKTTVMGNTYAKWLENPMMANEFTAILSQTREIKLEAPFNTISDVLHRFARGCSTK